MDDFVVRFRGVRGSYPVPGSTTLRYGGNTSCVEVWVGDKLIILDAGTGIVNLGDELLERCKATGQPIVATILFSHTHHDHTQGFPFFAPAYEGSSKFYMFGPKTFDQDLADALSRAMLAPIFPVALEEMPSLKIITNINDTEAIFIGPENEPQIRNIFREESELAQDWVCVHAQRSPFHPSGGVHLIRISWNGKSMVYATDTEGVSGGDARLIRFAQRCDLLIHDAQYTADEYVNEPRQGWGHSTAEMAVFVAQQAHVKRLVLFHHDPLHDDAQLDKIQTHAQQLFAHTVVAAEGLTITL